MTRNCAIDVAGCTADGFVWGPIEVSRHMVMPEGHHVIKVNDLTIYVSPTGRSVRVFRDGNELRARRS